MSTRRARIKAVASLPVRRKNAEVIKQNKSPRTPKVSTPVKDRNSPNNLLLDKDENVQKQKALSPRISTPLHEQNFKSSVSQVNTPNQTTRALSSKTSQNTPTLFASPKVKASPLKKHIPSPCVASPYATNRTGASSNKTINNILSTPTAHNVYNSVNESSTLQEDFNPPSVQESIIEDSVMDGIIPLQPTQTAPKPLDLLKNEIISENAEVVFDPIVPLPSPSKLRTKLRPVPRLAPLRRSSVQGSASESEDESRRVVHSGGSLTPAPTRQRTESHTSHSTLQSLPNRDVVRTRNDSVCSSVSQTAAHSTNLSSPLKEKHKFRRQDMSRRLAAMRRRFESVKPDTLTMYDLIFYNPQSNPIVPDQDEVSAKEANEKQEAELKTEQNNSEVVDDPPEVDAAPVPQIKLGPNGEIILDEQSLVIKTSDGGRKLSQGVVREGAWGGGGGKYSRAARTAEWLPAETVRFYRALAAVGTDFSIMAPLFPARTRRDLKLKFKKEEKLNCALIDKALRSATTWDATRLMEEFEQEREEEKMQALREKERLKVEREKEKERLRATKELKIRHSRGSKAMETGAPATLRGQVNPCKKPKTADEFIRRTLAVKAERKLSKTKERKDLAKIRPTQHTSPDTSQKTRTEMATPSKNSSPKTVITVPNTGPINIIPSNVENGSLVVLNVNDPNSSKKMLQTYISHGPGQLTPIALPEHVLVSLVDYMKNNSPAKSVTNSSPSPLTSPSSIVSQSGKSTPGSVPMDTTPVQRQRLSSYTITLL